MTKVTGSTGRISEPSRGLWFQLETEELQHSCYEYLFKTPLYFDFHPPVLSPD